MNSKKLQEQLRLHFPFDPTSKQNQIITDISEFVTTIGNRSILILKGYAGTGKTTVAIWRILRKKDDILFTYTRLLSASIRHLSKNKNCIWGAHQWYWGNCNGASLNDDIASNSVLETLMNHNIRLGKVVIDEGQDLDKKFYSALREISQSVSIGADSAQQLYDVDFSMNDINTLFPNNDDNPLTRNFRNRYEIYNFARHFIPHDVRANEGNMLERLSQQNPGGFVELHIENSSEGEYNKIKTIIDNRGQGNIGILLSYTKDVERYSEALDNKNIEHSSYHNKYYYKEKRNTEENLKNILVTTYKSAKGLEFNTVIMPSFQNANNNLKKEYYVGATRAKEAVYLLSTEDPDILSSFPSSCYKKISSTQTSSSSTTDDELPF